MKEDKLNISEANSALVAGGLSLNLFWILNIFKTTYPGFGAILTFYKPIGPLLGLFIVSIIFFRLMVVLLNGFKIKSQRFAFWFFVFSIAIFIFMVFPPVFEPIAHLLIR